ncbi:hypothetical protein, partial [Enterobacter cloacae complex sp. IR5422]|uniref:hypothetical protein n=1 Tax=Enterobacter cloacae complex sp. IR5422 TaxID=3412363 RepID=UPI003BA2EE02
VWRRLLENSLSAKVSCWLIRLLILGSGYNTMISHLGLIRTFLRVFVIDFCSVGCTGYQQGRDYHCQNIALHHYLLPSLVFL